MKIKLIYGLTGMMGMFTLGLLPTGTAQAQNKSSDGEAIIDYSKYGRKGAKARKAWLQTAEKVYDPNTVVYCDALWMRVHAADSPAFLARAL